MNLEESITYYKNEYIKSLIHLKQLIDEEIIQQKENKTITCNSTAIAMRSSNVVEWGSALNALVEVEVNKD